LFGSRAGNVLTKITIGLAIVFLVVALLIGLTYTGTATRGTGSIVDRLPAERPAQGQPGQPGMPLPGGEGASVLPLAPSPTPSGPAPSVPAPIQLPAPTPAPSGGTP
jgi:hypothetical protein